MKDKSDRLAAAAGENLPPEIAGAFAQEPSTETDAALRSVLADFQSGLRRHPYVQRLERRGSARWAVWGNVWRVLQPTMLAAAALGCVVLAVVVSLGPAAPTWAQVAEQFAAVKSFSVTLYIREDALSDVQQMELWMGDGGRTRIKTGSQVLFGLQGKVTRAFDVRERKEVEADRRAVNLLRMLGDRETFSLDVVVATFSGGALKDVTPQLSSDAAMAEDLAVYDIQSPRTPEWCRIWALRESRLPVRISVWDPRDGECADVVFGYGNEPPAAFFDAEMFAKRLEDRSISERTLGYVDLTDAGGKAYVPAVPHYSEALTAAVRTLDGKPWSLAGRKGKVTVLHVWDPRGYIPPDFMPYEGELKRLQAKHGSRDDFQIVTLAIPKDAAWVSKVRQEQGATWLFLHDGQGWDGELARAIGGRQDTALYLVDRQGEIHQVQDTMYIEAETVGLTYETSTVCENVLSQKLSGPARLTLDEVRAQIGEPDEVGDSNMGPNREQWTYILRDPAGEQEKRVILYVDRTMQKVVGLSSQNRILEPAVLKLTITPEYWKEKVLSQLDAAYRPENDTEDRYVIEVTARRDRTGYPFGWTQEQQDFLPGQTYERSVLHGTYQIEVTVDERKPLRRLQKIVLRDNVVLGKNSKTEITLE